MITEYTVKGKEYNLIYRKYNRETGLIQELARYEPVVRTFTVTKNIYK